MVTLRLNVYRRKREIESGKGKNKKFALRICAENNAALKVRKLIYDNMESESVITILEGHLWGEALKLLKQSPSRARVRRPKDGKNVLQVALLNNAPEPAT